MTGWRTLWRRVWDREANADASVSSSAVLGVQLEAPRPEPVPPARTLWFRGTAWQQQGTPSQQGLVTFVREIAVNGRPVQDTVQVHAADLTQRPDGMWALTGRE